MAQNDPYNPDFITVADGGSGTFDASASAATGAIVSEVAGDTDAEIYIEESNDGGSSWTQITQLEDEGGNTTFTAPFHSQFNRIMLEPGKRRLRIDNVDGGGNSGNYSVSGDER
jgi:hypothetical protein